MPAAVLQPPVAMVCFSGASGRTPVEGLTKLGSRSCGNVFSRLPGRRQQRSGACPPARGRCIRCMYRCHVGRCSAAAPAHKYMHVVAVVVPLHTRAWPVHYPRPHTEHHSAACTPARGSTGRDSLNNSHFWTVICPTIALTTQDDVPRKVCLCMWGFRVVLPDGQAAAVKVARGEDAAEESFHTEVVILRAIGRHANLLWALEATTICCPGRAT